MRHNESPLGHRCSCHDKAVAIGCHFIIPPVRNWLQRCGGDDRSLTTLAMENGFNQVDQSCFLFESRRVAVAMSAWCGTCFAEPSFFSSDQRASQASEEFSGETPWADSLALQPHHAKSVTCRSGRLLPRPAALAGAQPWSSRPSR